MGYPNEHGLSNAAMAELGWEMPFYNRKALFQHVFCNRHNTFYLKRLFHKHCNEMVFLPYESAMSVYTGKTRSYSTADLAFVRHFSGVRCYSLGDQFVTSFISANKGFVAP